MSIALPPTGGADATTWPAENQRWLRHRFAHLRRLLKAEGSTDPEADSATEAETSAPAALRVRALFGLSAFETDLLVLTAGVEIDAALRDAIARARPPQPGTAVRVSLAVALHILPEAHWDVVSPLRPLRSWSLVHFDMSDGLAQASLRIEERVLHYITGVEAFDDRIRGVARLVGGSTDTSENGAALRIARAMGGSPAPLILLADALADADRKRAGGGLAEAVFHHAGLQTMWVDPAGESGDGRNLADLARHLDREAALSAAAIALVADAESATLVPRLVRELRGPVIVLGSLSPSQVTEIRGRRVLRFSVPAAQYDDPPSTRTEVRLAAARALQQFRVEPALVAQVMASLSDAGVEGDMEARMWNALRECARGGLDSLAQRIESRATVEDLVLPPSVASQLREIASQLRHRQTVYEDWGFARRGGRGLGIAALFAGESGTGKTLAAEAIANEVALDLYRIDLASVVSKYIGETEKNLARLFDAAERSGAVLLFDEADALFGKRSEVKDSHDRYANIEVAYLLQRIEAYRGLAILTTNMQSALDRAFVRRIRFIVQFPFPDAAARAEIWRRELPASAPVAALDYDALARVNVAGGAIRNIALRAAFMAAERGGAIDGEVLSNAARAELAKLGRNPADARLEAVS